MEVSHVNCPQCGSELDRVDNDSGWMNDDQFDAVKAGDWCCEKCPGNGRSARNTSAYFWNREVGVKDKP